MGPLRQSTCRNSGREGRGETKVDKACTSPASGRHVGPSSSSSGVVPKTVSILHGQHLTNPQRAYPPSFGGSQVLCASGLLASGFKSFYWRNFLPRRRKRTDLGAFTFRTYVSPCRRRTTQPRVVLFLLPCFPLPGSSRRKTGPIVKNAY